MDFLIILDTYIQRAKKTYQDSRSRRNLNTLNTELHDVQRIMVQSIDDVLKRGAVLSGNALQKQEFSGEADESWSGVWDMIILQPNTITQAQFRFARNIHSCKLKSNSLAPLDTYLDILFNISIFL